MLSRKTLLTGVTTGILLLANVSPAFAQSVSPTGTSTSSKSAAACARISARVATAISNEQNVTTKVNTAMSRINNVFQAQGTNFKNKYGQAAYDTLNGYVNTLNTTYAPQVTADMNTVFSDLTNDQNMINQGNCGTTNGLFATQMKQTRSDRKKMRSDLEAYRDYVRNTIVPFIKGLRATTTVTPVVSPAK